MMLRSIGMSVIGSVILIRQEDLKQRLDVSYGVHRGLLRRQLHAGLKLSDLLRTQL